jgi:hypothetical protein
VRKAKEELLPTQNAQDTSDSQIALFNVHEVTINLVQAKKQQSAKFDKESCDLTKPPLCGWPGDVKNCVRHWYHCGDGCDHEFNKGPRNGEIAHEDPCQKAEEGDGSRNPMDYPC